jgi:beta-galactosidase
MKQEAFVTQRPQWPLGHRDRLGYGADYNPEQWPREVWESDVALMREAGVTIVSLGIFSWAQLEPVDEQWDFGWLDEAMDLLHAGGIAVDLATATASPPPWLAAKHPEILPVNERGQTIWPGGRQHWRPTSPIFRAYGLRLVERLASRYAAHPALAAWHVSNELGCHNVYDYSDDAAAAFRAWLRARYGTLAALNEAWGTAFWSQRYSDWEQLLPPRLAASYPNPTQQLDFKRFSSEVLAEYLRAERDVLRAHTPQVPVTTNFMVMGESRSMDYAAWVSDVDFLANDHYVVPGPQARDELSFSANLTGWLGGGRPWFLMEHSTSAVNWQPINTPKRPGELARDALTHLAHGADAICYFQWRQSRAGAEKYHSAMVPQAGPDSDVFRAVCDFGATLKALAPVTGTRPVPGRVAILFDWESWWAVEADSHPSNRVRYKQEALDWYCALLDLGLCADVVPVRGLADGRVSLSDYAVVVAPMLHLVVPEAKAALESYVEGGGHLVTTYLSGIVDEHDHFWPGAFPGALRDLLGVRVQEFAPLPDGDSVCLEGELGELTGTLWTDLLDALDAQVLARYTSGLPAGRPAITRRRQGDGSATYVSTRLGPAGLRPLLASLCAEAGLASPLPEPIRGRVELAVRSGEQGRFLFLINRGDDDVTIEDVAAVAGAGAKVIAAPALAGDLNDTSALRLGPRAVAVLHVAVPSSI